MSNRANNNTNNKNVRDPYGNEERGAKRVRFNNVVETPQNVSSENPVTASHARADYTRNAFFDSRVMALSIKERELAVLSTLPLMHSPSGTPLFGAPLFIDYLNKIVFCSKAREEALVPLVQECEMTAAKVVALLDDLLKSTEELIQPLSLSRRFKAFLGKRIYQNHPLNMTRAFRAWLITGNGFEYSDEEKKHYFLCNFFVHQPYCEIEKNLSKNKNLIEEILCNPKSKENLPQIAFKLIDDALYDLYFNPDNGESLFNLVYKVLIMTERKVEIDNANLLHECTKALLSEYAQFKKNQVKGIVDEMKSSAEAKEGKNAMQTLYRINEKIESIHLQDFSEYVEKYIIAPDTKFEGPVQIIHELDRLVALDALNTNCDDKNFSEFFQQQS